MLVSLSIHLSKCHIVGNHMAQILLMLTMYADVGPNYIL